MEAPLLDLAVILSEAYTLISEPLDASASTNSACNSSASISLPLLESTVKFLQIRIKNTFFIVGSSKKN